jgi:hypothetical protein
MVASVRLLHGDFSISKRPARAELSQSARTVEADRLFAFSPWHGFQGRVARCRSYGQDAVATFSTRWIAWTSDEFLVKHPAAERNFPVPIGFTPSHFNSSVVFGRPGE